MYIALQNEVTTKLQIEVFAEAGSEPVCAAIMVWLQNHQEPRSDTSS